jgi:hypothetical protein
LPAARFYFCGDGADGSAVAQAPFTFAFAAGRFLLKLFQVELPRPVMAPAPGERLLRFVGDKILFQLRAENAGAQKNWSARLRTNLGRAAARRREIISAHAGLAVAAGASWRDVPMQKTAAGWQLELPLAEVGYFKAKAYVLDEKNWQHWPDGSDLGISVHPNFARMRLHPAFLCHQNAGGHRRRKIGSAA